MAIDLANTLELQRDGTTADLLDDQDGLARWLRGSGGPRRSAPPTAEAAWACARAPRRRGPAAHPPAGGGGSGQSGRLGRSWVVQLEAGELVVRYNASPPDAFLADIATSAITLVGGPGRDRRQRRGAPGCGRWFVASRPRQRWCSPTCGDRARVARFQERRRARPGRTAHSAAAGPRMRP
jgi:predicted RNA-binding Zn ribbon-like protein